MDNATKMIHLIVRGHTVEIGDIYTFYCILICFENLMEVDKVWSWYNDMTTHVFTCIYILVFIFLHIWYILLLTYSILYIFYTGFFLCLPVRGCPFGFAKNLYFKIFLVNFPSFVGCMCDFGIGRSCWQDRNFHHYMFCVSV